jgi:hypothetical protein
MKSLLSLPLDLLKLCIDYLDFKDIVPLIGKIKEIDRLEGVKLYKEWKEAGISYDAIALLSSYHGHYQLFKFSMTEGHVSIKDRMKKNADRLRSAERYKILEWIEENDKHRNIESLNIKRFNIRDRIFNSMKVLIIGAKRSGKTTIVKDILHSKRGKFRNAICMSDNIEEYRDLFKEECMRNHYDTDAMKDIFEFQKKKVKTLGPALASGLAVVWDGVINFADRYAEAVQINGRQWKIFLIRTMQSAGQIPPNIRTCFDIVVLCGTHNLKDKRRMYNCYGTIFPTFQMFCDVFDELTKDCGCMVIENRVYSSKIEDNVFWYKANSHEEFKFLKEFRVRKIVPFNPNFIY